MDKISVLIADDHPAFREGLCRLLSDEEDLEIIAMAADGIETVTLATKMKPDVAVIDVAMPGISGIEAARQIKQDCPSTAVLIVSAYDEEAYVLASMRSGASGYVLKDVPIRELVSAIRMVHLGKGVFDLRPAGNILKQLSDKNGLINGVAKLHSRELEVLKLAARGMTNLDIAKKLVISDRTVQSHLTNIFRKLGVTSRTEAVVHAMKKGLLAQDDFA